MRELNDLPIEPEERSVFLSDAVNERLLDPLVVAPDRHFAAKQLADGRVLAADLSPRSELRHARAHVRTVVRRLLPRLEFVALPLVVGGTYDMTPDGHGIVDAIDAKRRVSSPPASTATASCSHPRSAAAWPRSSPERIPAPRSSTFAPTALRLPACNASHA